MAAEKTTGIVLRVIPFSETSCIVTLFTREFGKITAMAKGARRPKSPFEAALDVLAICRIVFLDKKSAMGLLTEAKLERRFRSASTNLKRLYAGYYIIELLNIFTDEGDRQPELFDLAFKTIDSLDSNKTDEDSLKEFLLQFELKMLNLLGHLPMLTKCVSCGREKTTLARVSFGLNAGGILCQTCRKGKSNIVSLSPNGLKLLLNLVGGQVGTKELNSDNWNIKNRADQTVTVKENKLLSFVDPIETEPKTNAPAICLADRFAEPTPEKCLGEVRLLINKYITHLLGFPPKLHKYLKNI